MHDPDALVSGCTRAVRSTATREHNSSSEALGRRQHIQDVPSKSRAETLFVERESSRVVLNLLVKLQTVYVYDGRRRSSRCLRCTEGI